MHVVAPPVTVDPVNPLAHDGAAQVVVDEPLESDPHMYPVGTRQEIATGVRIPCKHNQNVALNEIIGALHPRQAAG